MSGVTNPPIEAAGPAGLRARFEAADTDSRASGELYAEAAKRLLGHLVPVRLTPRTVVDLGAGTGTFSEALSDRYPRAQVIGVDFALPRLLGQGDQRAPRGIRSWLASSRASAASRRICADAERLPFADASVDMVASNLLFHWLADAGGALREARRIIRPAGLVVLSALGPGTLAELRQAWARCDSYTHLHPLPDMHELGDLMLAAGLADVVVDAERITLTYAAPLDLIRELRGLDPGNLCPGRPRGLTTPRRLDAVAAAYLAVPGAVDVASGRVRATVELVFAHAWGAGGVSTGRGDRGRSAPIEVAAPTLPPRAR